MSLNWNIANTPWWEKNGADGTYVLDLNGNEHLHPHVWVMTWSAVIVDVGNLVTVDHVREHIARARFFEATTDRIFFWPEGQGWDDIDPEMFVGMTVNVIPKSRMEWLKRCNPDPTAVKRSKVVAR